MVVNIINKPPTKIAIANPPVIKSSVLVSIVFIVGCDQADVCIWRAFALTRKQFKNLPHV